MGGARGEIDRDSSTTTATTARGASNRLQDGTRQILGDWLITAKLVAEHMGQT